MGQAIQRGLVIYITTDHGRDSATGKNHGGQSTRERTTWIVTNAQKLNDYFGQYQPAIVDIMPSIAGALDITPGREQQMEIDDVSLTGKVSLSKGSATIDVSDMPSSSERSLMQHLQKEMNKTGYSTCY